MVRVYKNKAVAIIESPIARTEVASVLCTGDEPAALLTVLLIVEFKADAGADVVLSLLTVVADVDEFLVFEPLDFCDGHVNVASAAGQVVLLSPSVGQLMSLSFAKPAGHAGGVVRSLSGVNALMAASPDVSTALYCLVRLL